VVTTTPRPIKLLKRMMADPATVMTKAATRANAGNLAPGFLRELFRLDGGGSFSPAGGSRRSRSGRNQAEQR